MIADPRLISRSKVSRRDLVKVVSFYHCVAPLAMLVNAVYSEAIKARQ